MSGVGKQKRRRGGFTLVELVFAVSVSVLLIAAMAASYLHFRYVYRNVEQSGRRNQNLRAAMTALERDLRLAGYGVSASSTLLPSWFPLAGTVTGVVTVVQSTSSNKPDSVTVIGALGSTTSYVQVATAASAKFLTVGPGDGGLFNAYDKNVIFIGGLEMARVVAVSGDLLTVTTSPSNTTSYLKNAYPYGSTIELVEAVTYQCGAITNGSDVVYYLDRNAHAGSLTASERAIAANIENFQVSSSGGAYVIELTGRNEETDTRYNDTRYKDNYRRTTLKTSVSIRN